jgi:hypothetical protein
VLCYRHSRNHMLMPQTGLFFFFVHDIRNSVLLLSPVFQPALQRFVGGLATNNQPVMIQALSKPHANASDRTFFIYLKCMILPTLFCSSPWCFSLLCSVS